MAIKEKKYISVTTPVFRVNWPSVFKKTAYGNNEPKYSIEALFPEGADISELKAVAKEVCVAAWGEDHTKWPKMNNPFRDQASKKKDIDGVAVLPQGYVEGAIFMKYDSKNVVGVVDAKANPTDDETLFYSGCYAKAHLTAGAYDFGGQTGVKFYLNHVQFVKSGEPLGGRIQASDVFKPVVQEGAATAASTSASDLF